MPKYCPFILGKQCESDCNFFDEEHSCVILTALLKYIEDESK